jgi:hypothetical protein
MLLAEFGDEFEKIFELNQEKTEICKNMRIQTQTIRGLFE